ncbi:AMP-dependent synthetase/ligase [Streptomyces hainanensis]|uniref:Acyl-CoA synthetase n=1 Tax=Streptomyces hainanensis TaxID=402648 RepID=A0A4R4T628_9ACTN|nr:AMP-dependent synthetase/ligase [Streptomyces hainanensis]TDC71306.1 long-chain fatty acid--CoA ligase [Streptomyces hainanensis]
MREFGLPARYEVSADSGLADVPRVNAERSPDLPVLARRRPDGGWDDVTAAAFLAEVRAVAKGLLASGVAPGDRIGLLSRTRYEWTLLDFAIWTAGAVPVPVYETSSPEQIAWNLSDSGAVAVVVEDGRHLPVVASLRDRLPELRTVWCLDPDGGEPGAIARLTEAGSEVADADLAAATAGVTPDSVATIVYTSGTTGRPKGCVLTHRAFLTVCGNTVAELGPLVRDPNASLLLFLPLAHVLARMVEVAALMAPLKLAHVPDVATLTDDLASYRPTLMLGVPRVFEKVYNAARAKADEEGRGPIFERAARTAEAYSRALDTPAGPGLALRLRHRLFDVLVYRRLRAALGGRATHAISGGAPLGARLGHFFRGVGFTVLEGYGLTETCAPTAFNPAEAPRIGTVGHPVPGTRMRIADDGEILVRGDHVFHGYWNNEPATSEVMSDGWLHTGDLGALDDEGYLTVTGRKREILVTAGGKNVAPAVIEDRVRAHALIAECLVVGDGRPYVAALITLDEVFLPRWAAEHGLADLDHDALLRHPELLAAVQAAVDDGNAAVSRAESIRRFRLLPDQFTESGGHLTPSMKLRRHVVTKDFAAEIDALYGGAA